MKPKLKKLGDQVIVITGASSGIGLTTARKAAQKGARVVLAARGEEALRKLRDEINAAGGQSIYVVADVTREEDVRRIAEQAISHFGGFDTWVNDAGVSVYGLIKDVPIEDERKVFDVNYWGTVYGSRAAVEHLRQRGGALINLGSVASDRGIPLQASYSASKHAIKAFTDTLRVELQKEGAPVSVTLIKPTAIDTPFFRHAKSRMDALPVEPSPMYAPEAVAKAILHAAQNPTRDLLVGGLAPVQSAMGRLFPKLGDRFVRGMLFEGQKSHRFPQPGENLILERSSGDLRERGGYDRKVLERSTYTEASMHPILTGALAVGAGVAMAAMLRARRMGSVN
jgi:NAD(P)-dependent dehydrogenase (short-subunit alcohol dehydrogenase family)